MEKNDNITEIGQIARNVFTRREFRHFKVYLNNGNYNTIRYVVSDKVEKINKTNITNNVQRKYYILLDRLEDLLINLCSA